nr:putative ribonuclease H-like domain-containing protein [Tanacetum cinerariifolium]
MVILSILRKHNLYTFSLNELSPKGPLTCLIAKALQTESTLWHKRLGHVNFKNNKKLVKGILVREKQFNHKVKAIRCDNGTEFKSANLIEFCGSKGIQWDYSNARTPQQNGVAERKNQTLIEVASTMLAYSILPTIFWTEAVATACYVLNRVLVTKPHDKTPYELLTGDKPFIIYLKPFGCHVTILNTSDPLGKFDKKSDEGYIIGYSISSKAYRVYNLVSRKIDETMNLIFFEKKPFVVGTGQAWMFEIDYFTNSLNYARVSSTNLTAGSQGAKLSNAVVPIVDEATTQNDGIKFDHATNNADNLDELTELQALQRQEQAGKEEADQLGLAFPSLNLILSVGSSPIGCSVFAGSTPPVSAGSTPLISLCASPISAYRHFIYAGKCHVSAGRPGSTGKPTGSAGFEDPDHPKKVYKVVKALYGLHQAPRAWYGRLSTFLLKHRYRRGTIDKTLFIKKDSKDIILVQVYVDYIIFGSTRKDWCEEFETLMQSEFEMSSMGPLTFFLGLQVDQIPDRIFIHQEKVSHVVLLAKPWKQTRKIYYWDLIDCTAMLSAEAEYMALSASYAQKHDVAIAYTVGPGERKEYAGTLPLCNKFKFHHNGKCTVKVKEPKPWKPTGRYWSMWNGARLKRKRKQSRPKQHRG